MTILFHRPTPWTSDIDCSTKIYAKYFASQGHNVIYLQHNISIYHLLTKNKYSQTWKERPRFNKKVWIICALSLLPYIDKLPYISLYIIYLNYFLCIPSIKRLVQKSGFPEPDIIWTTIPGSSILKKIFPNSKIIFHCIDNYSAYRGTNIEHIEKRDYKQVDHIFVIGEALKENLIKKYALDSKRLTNLGQGVDLDKYSIKDKNCSNEIDLIKGPKAIWVGLLKKIDIEYFKEVCKVMNKKKGAVILIGPSDEEVLNKLSTHNNLYYLGSKSIEEIPNYLNKCDIGLMLYNRMNRDIYEGQHPLKLYQYAAAGIPILSTWHREFETLKPPVIMIDKITDIEECINNSLINKIEWNHKLTEFIKNYTWENCASKGMSVINKLLSLTK